MRGVVHAAALPTFLEESDGTRHLSQRVRQRRVLRIRHVRAPRMSQARLDLQPGAPGSFSWEALRVRSALGRVCDLAQCREVEPFSTDAAVGIRPWIGDGIAAVIWRQIAVEEVVAWAAVDQVAALAAG